MTSTERRLQGPNGYLYDTPGKNLTRKHGIQLFVNGKSKERLRRSRVLFLPSEQGLEVPIYNRAGIPNEHLQGVERDARIATTITSIHTFPLHTGTLRSFLNKELTADSPQPFDWCWLDFDGSMHTFQWEIQTAISLLRNEEGNGLGVTSIATRDRHSLFEGAVNIGVVRSCIDDGYFLQLVDAIIDHHFPVGRPRSNAGVMLMENIVAREITMLSLVVRGIGQRCGGSPFTERMDMFLTTLRTGTQSCMRERRAKNQWNPHIPCKTVDGLELFLKETPVDIYPKELLRTSYVSKSGQRLLTWFFLFAPVASYDRRSLWNILWDLRGLFAQRDTHLIDTDGSLIAPITWCPICKP